MAGGHEDEAMKMVAISLQLTCGIYGYIYNYIYISKQTCFSLVNVSVAQVFVSVKEMIEEDLDTVLHVFHI